AEGVRPLGNDTEIRVGDDARHVVERHAAAEFDSSIEVQPLALIHQGGLLVTAAVDMKLQPRQLIFDQSDRVDCDVQTLVPLKAAGKQHYELIVVAGAGMRVKQRPVDVI